MEWARPVPSSCSSALTIGMTTRAWILTAGCVQQSGVRVGPDREWPACRSRMIEGHRVILRETVQSHSSKGIDAMTTAHDIDLAAVLADRLTTTHPDVLRELLADVHPRPDGRRSRRPVRRRLRRAQHRAHQPAQRLPAPPIRHPRRHIGSGDPQAAAGLLLPGLAAGAPQARRAGADHGGGHLLPARGVHPADGQARRDPGHHQLVEVAGLGDGQGARRRGRGVPHPAAGRRPVHVRRRRRPGAQGPREAAGWSTCTP